MKASVLLALLLGTALLGPAHGDPVPASSDSSTFDSSIRRPRTAPRPRPPAADEKETGAWEKRSSFLRGRIYHSAVWTYAEMIVWGGGSEHQFYNDGGIYDPAKDKWRAVSQENAPSGRWGHAAVWTGTEMIVWGGRSSFAPANHKNDGAIYNPATDSWRPMSAKDAPSARSQMAAVWTGKELLVWGGWADEGDCPTTGASYNPATDTWTPMSAENAPEGRLDHAFVWTGDELIVWGGLLKDCKRSAGTGGRYDPGTKTWEPLSTEGAPISVRGTHAVWTGSEMVVWGGAHLDGENLVNVGRSSGGRYHPASDTWTPTAITGAPHGRMGHGTIWTGSEMIVWSGGDQVEGNVSTGGRYDPDSNAWRPTANTGAPSGRGLFSAVWTGEGVLYYGGSTGGVEAFNETHYYLPYTTPSATPSGR
jgi:N-acetylneuraminic acid mutarotase